LPASSPPGRNTLNCAMSQVHSRDVTPSLKLLQASRSWGGIGGTLWTTVKHVELG